jgi:hypothetical protein
VKFEIAVTATDDLIPKAPIKCLDAVTATVLLMTSEKCPKNQVEPQSQTGMKKTFSDVQTTQKISVTFVKQ